MKNLKREINLKWKPYIIATIVCFLMSLVGLILSSATWDTPRKRYQVNYDQAFEQFKNSQLNPQNLPASVPSNSTSRTSKTTISATSTGGVSNSPPSPPPSPPPPPQDEFSKSWFGECLNVHNNYRSMLENIKDGSSVPGFSWSNDLARDAFSWARHLSDVNSGLKHSTSFGHGENLYSSTNGPKNCEPAIAAFFDEWSLYHNEKIGEGDFHAYGHFTQVAWPSSVRLGCAFADNRNTRYTVCHYDPPGNMLGQRLDIRVKGKSSY